MANIDSAFGLKYVRGPSRIKKCYINSSYGTALFKGDPVIKVAGGSNTAIVSSGTETHEIGTLPAIEKAAAGDGNVISGVIVGFEATPSNLDTKTSPASTEGVALVEMHPEAIYEIQADGIVAAATMGLNAVLIYTNAGSTTSGLSGVELDTSSDAPAADASNQLLILRASEDTTRNDVAATNTVVEVLINQHSERTPALGI